MEQSNFEKLPLRKKVFHVLERGKAITARQFLHYHIKLYAYSDFFVELWYIPAANKIERVEVLTLDDVLQIYKNDFDISGLMR